MKQPSLPSTDADAEALAPLPRNRLVLLWLLFWNGLAQSSVTVGGGYVIVSMLKKKYVEELRWISMQEMMDLTAIAQSAPGPVVVNTSMLLGYRLGGLAGAASALLGILIPPLVIISLFAIFYEQCKNSVLLTTLMRFMRAGVAAVIIDVVWDMILFITKQKRVIYYVLFGSALLASYFFSVNAVVILLVCLAVGLLDCYCLKRQLRKSEDKP